MNLYFILLSVFFLGIRALAADHSGSNDFLYNYAIIGSEREAIAPYILPKDHPIKEELDAIFCSTRVTLNQQTFRMAGFIIKYSQPRSFIRVASHPAIPGYLVKVYLDSEHRLKRNTEGWVWFVRRIEGVNKIHEYITSIESKFFVAPKKWIYPLPINPSIPGTFGYQRKNEILVVEDMRLVSKEKSTKAWKTKITKDHLDELYGILYYAGGNSYRPDNIAYTEEGKFAFIDTEYSYIYRSSYESIKKYLSPEMAKYWETKCRKGK